MTSDYPRDLVGYGQHPPHPQWPNQARLALQFVINYEEGGENCVLTAMRLQIVSIRDYWRIAAAGVRNLNMESMYEYGSRAGFWRLHRLFTERNLPLTVYAVAMALQRNPEAGRAMVEAGWEVASHGYRWIDYRVCGGRGGAIAHPDSRQFHTEVIGTRPLGFTRAATALTPVA